jgi:glyoxylase-like metal-dependent hydrolase (beta-lactamase superfamily II)
MPDPLIIDTKMHDFEGITGTFVVVGEKVALVETGPKSSVDNVLAGLQHHGIDRVDWIVVTHIHLDHAGAAGTLARHFPEATIAVHRVGAPHLVDPAKLWSSASRIYGDRMEEMWGGIDPIDEDRIRPLDDGDKIDLGGRSLQALDTPGHAYHHHAYLDDDTGIVFTGDALGVVLPGLDLVRPATPPPEFHLEKAIASIGRLREIQPTALWPTHFPPASPPVDELCDAGVEALNKWGGWVREARAEGDDLDMVAEAVRARARADAEGRLAPADVDRLEQTTSYRMNAWGYVRYMDKQERSA